MGKTPLVSICCITYNHAPYISQCVDGFLMQKTTFPFEIIINDDCSNDGTTEILKDYAIKYPELIHLILHDENQYSKGVRRILATFVYPVAKGKYIALCEGDDYWTDPYKLQKQVDYLESHPECGLVYTDYSEYVQNTQTLTENMIKSGRRPQINTFEEHLCKTAYIAPPSWLYRIDSKAVEEHQKNKGFIDGSFSLALEFFKHSEVCFMEDTTCVYRVLDNSASHYTSPYMRYLYAKNVFEEQLYFGSKYDVKPDILKRIRQKFYRKYYAQILSYEDNQQQELLKLESKSFDSSSISNSALKVALSSSILALFLSAICKIRYPKD